MTGSFRKTETLALVNGRRGAGKMSNLSDEEIDKLTRKQIESKFIGSFDIPEGKTVSLEISKVIPPGHEELHPGVMVDKTVLEFNGTPKKLILNNTNFKVLCVIHGLKPSRWVGKKIEIIEGRTGAWKENNVPCVRVVCPKGAALPYEARKHAVIKDRSK